MAETALKASELLLDHGLIPDAASRAYYAGPELDKARAFVEDARRILEGDP